MNRIFISYRSKDADIWASRLEEELNKEFPGQIFLDFKSIVPGTPWRTALDAALAT